MQFSNRLKSQNNLFKEPNLAREQRFGQPCCIVTVLYTVLTLVYSLLWRTLIHAFVLCVNMGNFTHFLHIEFLLIFSMHSVCIRDQLIISSTVASTNVG